VASINAEKSVAFRARCYAIDRCLNMSRLLKRSGLLG
jgi:hypothetical protein